MTYDIARDRKLPQIEPATSTQAGYRHPLGKEPQQTASPATRAMRVIAAALAVMVALSLSCTPQALATTGVTSNQDAGMRYYWSASQSSGKHYLHKLGDQWVYCVNPYKLFKVGKTYTGEDPVKTGKLSQKCVTDLALAYKYVWDEGLYRTPDGDKLSNDYERYAAAQVLIWTVLLDYYPSLGPSHNRITVKGKDVTGDGDTDKNNKAAYSWIAGHRDEYIGHCEYFGAGSDQSFAMSFTCEPVTGSISLVKHSSNTSITSGNPRYSLKGAVYGVYSDKACTKTEGELVTDANGTARLDNVPAGTHYVKEIKAPAGFALDATVYAVAVKSGKTVSVGGSAGVVDVAQTGSVSLRKTSSNESITNGNACYSLSDAEYGVFSDAACTTRVGTLTTGDDGKARIDNIPLGSYYVKETKTPEGFAIDASVYSVEVNADEVSPVNGNAGVSETPQHSLVEVFATKRDAETPEGTAQGAATLKGAQFTIEYYDGYFSAEGLPSSPTRTWVIETDDNGNARADADHLVEGDELYYTADGSAALPLGTFSIQETSAPSGYHLGDGENAPEPVIAHVKANGSTTAVVAGFEPAEASDSVKRGGIAVGKVDRQHRLYLAQGAASLEGATFEIVSDNDQLVVVDGYAYARGAVVKTMQTQAEGDQFIARTESDCLPVGAYTVREAGAPEGYLLDEESAAWSQPFEIAEEGAVADFTEPEEAVSDLVIRGDFEFSKIDGQSAQRLANVPFLISSDTTGEAHILVTDENGMASTSAEWNAHTQDTNGNDDAVSEDSGIAKVDEEALKPSAGIWFSGRADATCDPDDRLGALPFDTYTIRELPCSANEGLELVSFTTVITRNNRELDLGTVDDNARPALATSLADGNGAKLVIPSQEAMLVDTVSYANLSIDSPYTISGQLHAVGEDGQDLGVVAEGSTELNPKSQAGTAEVVFSFDATNLQASRLVAFEQLVDSNGSVVCEHADIDDPAQSVTVPAIETSLKNPDGAQNASSTGMVELVDTVSYSGLAPAKTYLLNATLHVRDEEGADAGELTDSNGQPVTARHSFTPAESSGTVDVTFLFEAPAIAGKTVVAFEELSFRDVTYATHADISDEAQSMAFPSIATTLTNTDGGDEIEAQAESVLIDTVAYENLAPGARYTLVGTLHLTDESEQDLGVLRDANGTPIKAKTLFTPDEPNGIATVQFTIDARNYPMMTLVAFETLLDEGDVVLASHEDITDTAQSVYVEDLDEPEEEVDESESVTLDEPRTQPAKLKAGTASAPTKKASAMAKTGDDVSRLAIVLAPAAAIALALATLAIRRMRAQNTVSIPRGRHGRSRR